MHRLLALLLETTVHLGHDSQPPASRSARWQMTWAEQTARYLQARDGVTEDEFVAMRQARRRRPMGLLRCGANADVGGRAGFAQAA